MDSFVYQEFSTTAVLGVPQIDPVKWKPQVSRW